MLDHGPLDPGVDLQQAERHADLIVVVERGRAHAVAALEHGGGDQLRRRLADVAGNADHLEARQRLAPGRGRALQPGEGVGDDEDGRVTRRIVGGRAFEQQPGSAARHGIGREVVAVGALAGQGDEEIAGLDTAGVDDGAPEGRVGAAPLAQRAAECARDEGRIEGGA